MEMAAGFGFLRKSRQANACLAKGYVYLPKKAATQTGLYLAARRGILPVNGKEFKMEDLLQILQKPLQQREVEVSDLPDLDLYMDQITTLFADKTQEPDGLLTKTMINNYSKDGLIKPIKGKKYSKEHILQMLLIYRLKQTLSIQQIKGVMQNLSAQVEDQPSEQIWKELYAGYLNSREHNGEILSSMLEDLLKRTQVASPAGMAQLLLQLSWISHMTKRMCDVLVEQAFPPAEKEKKKEK